MKGPGHRHRFDVRRSWECPACHRRVRTSGRIVHLLCECLTKNSPPQQTWMRLLEGVSRPPLIVPVIVKQEEAVATRLEEVLEQPQAAPPETVKLEQAAPALEQLLLPPPVVPPELLNPESAKKAEVPPAQPAPSFPGLGDSPLPP